MVVNAGKDIHRRLLMRTGQPLLIRIGLHWEILMGLGAFALYYELIVKLELCACRETGKL
jgi:hypothetical protein